MESRKLPELPEASFFTNRNRHKIAYIHHKGQHSTIVFLHGYMSDMYGDKSLALYQLAIEKDYGFLALEYTGNGRSEGDFIKDGCIGCWANDALEVIQSQVAGKVILVGSSMGGWLAFWLAKKLTHKVQAIVGIAAAPDFTQDLMPQNIGKYGMDQLAKEGVIYEESQWDSEYGIPWTNKLYQDGKDQLVMDTSFHQPHIKVRLLQGLADDVVPWSKAIEISHWLNENDVEIWMPKDGDHRLSTVRDLDKLRETILSLTLEEKKEKKA